MIIFIGGGLCCMSSFPYIWDSSGTPKGDARFYMALFGQAITGVACPFVSSVPTKVMNKNWFGYEFIKIQSFICAKGFWLL